MNEQLIQDKLDVINKGRSNIFNWKGQFTPEFVEYILSEYGTEGCAIADPFSGSGTVLSESINKGCSCIGFELNPSAYFMSKFFEYAKLPIPSRMELVSQCSRIIKQGFSKFGKNAPVYEEKTTYRESYSNLLSLASFFSLVADDSILPLLINVLFLCEKDKKLSLAESVRKRFDYLCKVLYSLPETNKTVKAYNLDARAMGDLCKGQIDTIVTSPPYINVFNYHQNYRGIVEQFGFNILRVANSEIGANRKFRSNRFRTVVQYSLDMGDVLVSCDNSLKKGGRMIFVVGRESMVRKTPFYNSKILEDIVGVINNLSIESVNQRTFRNRYGESIKEDILVISKHGNLNNIDRNQFYDIGLSHIEKALEYALPDAKAGLREILVESDHIQESPIYCSYDTVRA